VSPPASTATGVGQWDTNPLILTIKEDFEMPNQAGIRGFSRTASGPRLHASIAHWPAPFVNKHQQPAGIPKIFSKCALVTTAELVWHRTAVATPASRPITISCVRRCSRAEQDQQSSQLDHDGYGTSWPVTPTLSMAKDRQRY